MKIGTSVEQFIGNTPLVELGNIEKKLGLKAHILAKLEYFNPAGSVKDRVAKFLIDDAEKRGVLRLGAAIVEPTSGNTGIGLASVGARLQSNTYHARQHVARAHTSHQGIRSRSRADRCGKRHGGSGRKGKRAG